MKKSLAILFSSMLLSACSTSVDVLVVGGGTSGVAAGIQAARSGVSAMIVEEGPWLGGMLTSAGVGAVDGNYSLRGGIFGEFCDSLASYYGGYDSLRTGWVSNIMFEPHVGNGILCGMAAGEPLLDVRFGYSFEGAEKLSDGWKVTFCASGAASGARRFSVRAKVLVDATELGDVAAACGVKYRIGMDSREETGESIAPEQANDIVQDMTYVAILKDYGSDADMTIERPDGYDPDVFANCCKGPRNTVPRPGQALWSAHEMLDYGKLPGGKYMLNWPIEGNDYYANVIEMTSSERLAEYEKAKDFTRCFIYYIQTELGFRNLGLADDEFPTDDKFPFIPYHRESRRIEGEAFLTVDHAARPFEQDEPLYRTGIAVGDYAVDHHHHRYPHWEELPELHFYPIPSYNVPLGSLVPKGVENLVVAEKSISVSNIINGTTRLQPVVMQVGQAAGALAALSVAQGQAVREVPVRDVQDVLLASGGYIMPYRDLTPDEAGFAAIQRIGAAGIVQGEGRNEGWANQTWFSSGRLSSPAISGAYRAEWSPVDYAVRLDSISDPFHNIPVDLKGNIIARRASLVNPLIGSGGHGHVSVGASVPHGMVNAGPDNVSEGWDWCSGYHDSDRTIAGFAQNHLSGTGIADLGEIVIMPFAGRTMLDKGTGNGDGYAVTYDKATETVMPGYYSVTLDDTGIHAEMTATEKVAFHSYHYPEGEDAPGGSISASGILLDLKSAPKSIPSRKGCLDSYACLKDAHTIAGWRLSDEWARGQKVWFEASFSEPILNAAFYNDGVLKGSRSAGGDNVRALLDFGEVMDVDVRIAISYTSAEGASGNLAEADGMTFMQAREHALMKWEQSLSSIDFKGIAPEVDTIFYTALYHTAISPQLFSDTGNEYSIFSLWDTYRAVHPLYALVDPAAPDYINSLIGIAEKYCRLPVWHLAGKETDCMVGVHSVHVIADAVLKEMEGVDPWRAYDQIKKFAGQPVEGLEYADEPGWIPADRVNWSVSRALEYCIDDDAVSRAAAKLGDYDAAGYYASRAKGYRNYFHEGFMRGRLADGSWRTPFDPSFSLHEEADYVEGNAWQYTWLVPHDVDGLIGLAGGKDAFLRQLDALFAADSSLNEGASADITGMIGQYAHGNEPSHHIAYLYALAGEQARTSELVRQICGSFYTTAPDGLIGNEDCGQMSAWYIFSALGFYPVNPLDGKYVFGSPLVREATLHLSNGKEFRIFAHGNSNRNRYIGSVVLNGQPYNENFITYDQLRQGGTLEFVMTDKKN